MSANFYKGLDEFPLHFFLFIFTISGSVFPPFIFSNALAPGLGEQREKILPLNPSKALHPNHDVVLKGKVKEEEKKRNRVLFLNSLFSISKSHCCV